MGHLRWTCTLLASAVAAVISGPTSNLQKPFGVISDAGLVNGTTYDYIVVGGGLSGLTVAARLSEDLSTRVLVVEAGGDNRTNPQIFDILQFTVAIGGPMDWHWKADLGKAIAGCVLCNVLTF